MSIGQHLRDDFRYVIFSNIYQKLSQPKARKEAFNLLNVAIEVFAVKGMLVTTKTMIANKAGVSASKLTYYFKTLDEIKLSAIKYTRVLYQSYVLSEMEKQVSVSAKFEAYFTCCQQWPLHNKNHTKLWIGFLHECTSNKKFRSLNTEAVETGRRRLEELIELGMATGEFNVEDSWDASAQIQMLLTGLLLSNATEEASKERERRIKVILRQCRGILSLSLKKSV